MKIRKKVNLNERGFIGLSTSNAIEGYPYILCKLWTLSSLDYFKYNIHENWEKSELQ